MQDYTFTEREVRVEKVAMRIGATGRRVRARHYGWDAERQDLSRRRLFRYFARKLPADAQPVDEPHLELGEVGDDFIRDRYTAAFTVRAVRRGELADGTRVQPGVQIVKVPVPRRLDARDFG